MKAKRQSAGWRSQKAKAARLKSEAAATEATAKARTLRPE